jgi:putative oxidoreductase
MAMNQHILSRFAIFLLAIVLIVFGIEHFVHPRNMLIYVPTWIPGGLTWVYIVGAACILVAISFMLNQMVKVTAYLLALLLFSFVFCVHLPNYLNTADPEYRQLAFLNILKDTALAAFALYIASNARHQKILEETVIEEEVKKSDQAHSAIDNPVLAEKQL